MNNNQKFFEYVELYAKEVIESSSQYGADGRTAFVAENLAGPPSIYPEFADSTRSCAFINFSTHWEKYPGAFQPVSGGIESHTSTDFVDVFFERPVIVVALQIYETYFPGAVVAIRACYRDQPVDRPVNLRGLYWATLWQTSDRGIDRASRALGGHDSILPSSSVRPVQVGKARIFEPILSNIPLVPTDLIRIEFDIRRVAYHTQLDAVKVKGYAPISDDAAEVLRKMHSEMYSGWKARGRRDRTVSCNELEGSSCSHSCNNTPKRIPLTNCLPAPPEEVDDCCNDRPLARAAPVNVKHLSNSILCPLSMNISRMSTQPTVMALMNQTTLSTYESPFICVNCPLLGLPHEVLLHIFSYFDLSNLLRVSSVCRLFYNISSECISRFQSLNLQALWLTTSDSSLYFLSRRLKQRHFVCNTPGKERRSRTTGSPPIAVETTSLLYPSWSSVAVKGVTQTATIISSGASPSGKIRSPVPMSADENADGESAHLSQLPRLRRLDLSWCGNYQAISTSGFCRFLSEVGQFLSTLRLSSCQMINDEGLLHIINTCGLLKELDLSSCRSISSGGFVPLGRLIHLRWLSLYRTRISDSALLNLSSLCQHLRHVNLGACCFIEVPDACIHQLTASNPLIESLNLWRCLKLTSVGVIRISENCPNLQLLDIGWCSSVETQLSNCIRELVSRCRLLRVLGLTAVRSVSPNDLISMAEYLCGSLEHLDLVGNALVTESCVTRLLAKCVKLTFLDISHCTSISLADVMALRTAYTNCAIASNHHTFIPPPFPGPPVNFFLQSLTSSRAQPALFLPPPTSPPPPSPPQENQEFNP